MTLRRTRPKSRSKMTHVDMIFERMIIVEDLRMREALSYQDTLSARLICLDFALNWLYRYSSGPRSQNLMNKTQRGAD
jgi:hypothetical protein